MAGKNAARAAPMSGVGGLELMLGGENVRTALQQIGRQSRRHLGQGIRRIQGRRRRQVLRQRPPDQQHQIVFRLRPVVVRKRPRSIGRFAPGPRRCANPVRTPRRPRNCVWSIRRTPRPPSAFAGPRPAAPSTRVPGIRRCRPAATKRDLGAPTGFLGGKIIFQRRGLETAHPSEQIDFVGGCAEIGPVEAGGQRLAVAGQNARKPLAAAAGGGVDGGKQRRRAGCDTARGTARRSARPRADQDCWSAPAR